jgi:hypothetical protein
MTHTADLLIGLCVVATEISSLQLSLDGSPLTSRACFGSL